MQQDLNYGILSNDAEEALYIMIEEVTGGVICRGCKQVKSEFWDCSCKNWAEKINRYYQEQMEKENGLPNE